MATSVVLPLEIRAKEWHDSEHKFYPYPTSTGSSYPPSVSMARPPPSAEPKDAAFSNKPSLPPFSKFLSDAGHPDLFPQPSTIHVRREPLLSNGSSLVNHPSQFRLANSYPPASSTILSQPRNGQSDVRNGHLWSYPNPNPLGAQQGMPGSLSANLSSERGSGPATVREEVVPGRGLCYVYEDGAIVPKVPNVDSVNPKWGTTKAGKPRKRLGQACNTCREKKIKCDPSVPKCAQCQKFGRECKFDST